MCSSATHIVQDAQQHDTEVQFLAQSKQNQGVLLSDRWSELPRRRHFSLAGFRSWENETQHPVDGLQTRLDHLSPRESEYVLQCYAVSVATLL